MTTHKFVVSLAGYACVLVLVAATGCSTATTTGSGPNSGEGTVGGNNSGRGPNSGGGMNGGNSPGRGPNSGGGMMGGNTPGSGPGGGITGNGSSGTGNYASDGERIYLTGVGVDGRDIPRNAPAVSQGSRMMGGGGCGSCHAADGRGGTIRMMMGPAIETPDITYDALIKEGFTDATIKDAIVKGVDEAGKPLEEAMPRWQMSGADLDATIAYLKVVGAR